MLIKCYIILYNTLSFTVAISLYIYCIKWPTIKTLLTNVDHVINISPIRMEVQSCSITLGGVAYVGSKVAK